MLSQIMNHFFCLQICHSGLPPYDNIVFEEILGVVFCVDLSLYPWSNYLPLFSARVRFQSFFSNQTLGISIEIPYKTSNVIQ